MSTANELSCNNCGVGHGQDDIFCENCGYDFITGSLPGPSEQLGKSVGSIFDEPRGGDPPAPSIGSIFERTPLPTVVVNVEADRRYFDTVVSEGELTFPDPQPAAQTIELTGPEIHIGRTSQSKAIHPDIDVAALTGDPAVSSRHAVIRIDPSGAMSVTDIGSTNGTYLDSPAGPSIAPGQPMALAHDASIFVGAWTRVTITGQGAQ